MIIDASRASHIYTDVAGVMSYHALTSQLAFWLVHAGLRLVHSRAAAKIMCIDICHIDKLSTSLDDELL